MQPDGSTALAYDDRALARIDLSRGTGDLPGWAAAYDAKTLQALLAAYREIDAERLWENLAYFLERVVPVAERAACAWRSIPTIRRGRSSGCRASSRAAPALERLIDLVDSPANGVTFCTGSLGADPEERPARDRALASAGAVASTSRIAATSRITGEREFHEAPHPSRFGDVTCARCLRALADVGFAGPMRPDHGRMIWGEHGRPGYGLHDRALGAMYLQGLWEGLERA